MSARIFSQRLDRHKPLWEMWLVDGLAGGRFAMILKTHHSVIDGIAGVDVATVLLGNVPTTRLGSRRPHAPGGPWGRCRPTGELLEIGLREASRRAAALKGIYKRAHKGRSLPRPRGGRHGS